MVINSQLEAELSACSGTHLILLRIRFSRSVCQKSISRQKPSTRNPCNESDSWVQEATVTQFDKLPSCCLLHPVEQAPNALPKTPHCQAARAVQAL